MIYIKKIKPMFTAIVTTMNKYEQDSVLKSGLIDVSKQQGTLKEYQTVIAVGDSVRGIKVGDCVWINPTRFGVKKHQEGSLKDGVITDNPIITYNFDVIKIDGKDCLLLQDRDVEFIVEEFEERSELSTAILEEKKIII
jgi:hypothetical protein